jgi:hypothetical protein
MIFLLIILNFKSQIVITLFINELNIISWIFITLNVIFALIFMLLMLVM